MGRFLSKRDIHTLLVVTILIFLALTLFYVSENGLDNDPNPTFEYPSIVDDVENTFFVANDKFVSQGIDTLGIEMIKEQYPLLSKEQRSLGFDGRVVDVEKYGNGHSSFTYVVSGEKALLWQMDLRSSDISLSGIKIGDSYVDIYHLFGIDVKESFDLSVSNLEGHLNFLLSFDSRGNLERIQFESTYLD
ncbi:hypothetical protein L0Y40_00415 [Candidatus Wolfebacteria bacterium]|nr:hypothetical protein [Candidatus Wolfebacteria bacterium]